MRLYSLVRQVRASLLIESSAPRRAFPIAVEALISGCRYNNNMCLRERERGRCTDAGFFWRQLERVIAARRGVRNKTGRRARLEKMVVYIYILLFGLCVVTLREQGFESYVMQIRSYNILGYNYCRCPSLVSAGLMKLYIKKAITRVCMSNNFLSFMTHVQRVSHRAPYIPIMFSNFSRKKLQATLANIYRVLFYTLHII